MAKYKFLSWQLFRAICHTDAELWHDQGYTADELTADDILNEYPEDYFDATEYEANALERCFTPQEFAEKTLEYMEAMEEAEYER